MYLIKGGNITKIYVNSFVGNEKDSIKITHSRLNIRLYFSSIEKMRDYNTYLKEMMPMADSLRGNLTNKTMDPYMLFYTNTNRI